MIEKSNQQFKSIVRIAAIMVMLVGLMVGLRLILRGAGITNTAGWEDTASAQQSALYPDVPAEVLDNLTLQNNTQQIEGVALRTSNFYALDGFVYVEACVQTGRAGPWEVFRTSLAYTNGISKDYAVHINAPVPANEQCMMLQYAVPADADLSTLKLTIENLVMSAPDEGKMCEEFNARIGASQLAANGIQTTCDEGPGHAGVSVAAYPDDITQDQAEQMINQAIFPQLYGPWVFTGSVDQ